jgi:hypothetical protein
LNRNDPLLLEEIRIINEQMKEKKQMLIERMERQFKYITGQCNEEIERLNEEETEEVRALTELMYNRLEKMKEGLEDKVTRIDLFDKRSLDVIHLAEKEVDLEPALLDEEE